MSVFLSRLVTIIALVGAALKGASQPASPSYVADSHHPGSFPLVADGRAAPLYVSEADWPGVQRALRDVQADIARVTGREPLMLTDAPAATGQPVVLVGTLGHSPLLDKLVRAGKLDATALRGRYEKFVTCVVERPLPGVAQALVVAGSDQRGTIYGLYELSAQAGVSPWHWWADVPVMPRRALYVAAGPHTLGEPAVRHRGLVLGAGSATLATWSRARYGGRTQPATERLVELVLRLKGNCLWPGTLAADPASLDLLHAYGLETPPDTSGQLPEAAALRYAPAPGTSALATWARLHQEASRHSGQPWLLGAASTKGQELTLSLLLDYAWNPAAFASAATVPAYTQRWAAQQFGAAPAAAIAGLLATVPTDSAGPSGLREAVAEAHAHLARAEAGGSHLPAADLASYFELVVYPAADRAIRAELAYCAARQHEAHAQGHAARAAEQAAQGRQLLAQAEALRTHYHALLGGKWQGLLDPPAQALPPTPAAPPATAEARAGGQ